MTRHKRVTIRGFLHLDLSISPKPVQLKTSKVISEMSVIGTKRTSESSSFPRTIRLVPQRAIYFAPR